MRYFCNGISKIREIKHKGVVGTIRAFAEEDEEQSQGTLCGHWQVYVEELNNELRNGLFQGGKSDRLKAKQKTIDHIDIVMNATYGEDIMVEHTCHKVGKEPTTKIGTMDQLFQQRPLQELRNACYKNLCNDVRGESLNARNERNFLQQQIL